jgi:hypothetical protein
MRRLSRSLRTRSLDALGWAASLLAILALATAGLESVSFGHQHVAGGHSLYHHHVFFGPHEHCGAPSDHDHHPDHDHDHGAPAPQHRDAQRRTATVSAAPALAQAIGIGVLASPLTQASPATPAAPAASPSRPARRLAPPRAPPSPLSPFRVS